MPEFHRRAKPQKYFRHTLEYRDVRTLEGARCGFWLIRKGGKGIDRALTRDAARRRIRIVDAANA
tara:strand:- start:123 stop:317 length:195 start_codon:yes stop_codon:yes gene_type:complete